MEKFKKGISGILAFIMLCSAFVCSTVVTANAADNTIWIVGDSTSCSYKSTQDTGHKYKRVGFGDMIGNYIDTSKYTVKNLALSGRSSKSFTLESNYKELDSMQSGDILIIAFGHNDEKSGTQDPNGTLHTTVATGDSKDTEGSFKKSLYDNYVQKAIEKNATPVLCSPIVRLPAEELTFSDKDLHNLGSGADYANAVKELATTENIAFIDLTNLTKNAYSGLDGEDGITYEDQNLSNVKRYLLCHAWENETTIDHTHLSKYGADLVAYLMANAVTGIDTANTANIDSLSSVFKAGPTKPVLDNAYLDGMLNPEYVAPSADEPTIGTIEDTPGYTQYNDLWSVQKTGWYGSAFGDIGGNPSAERFEIAEDGDKVNVAAKNNSGKISATKTGMAMYFTPISAAGNYMISAHAKINSIGTSDNQTGFGAIITDRILINTKDSSFNTNYAAATPYNLASGAPLADAAVRESSMEQGVALPALPAAGDEADVTVIKIGNEFTTCYKTEYGTFVKKFNLEGYMEGTIYAGLFAARNADITFSNISTTNEVIEKEDPIDYQSGAVTFSAPDGGGTVTVSKDGGTVSSGETVDGGTVLTITATPAQADTNRASIKVGNKELTGNTYTWKVNGDITFNVSFPAKTARTAITGADANIDLTAEDPGASITKIQQYNQFLEGPYYYDLTQGTSLDAVNKRISLGKGDSTRSSIVFSTGDITGLGLKVHFKTGSAGQARSLVIGKGEDKATTTIGTDTEGVNGTDSAPFQLEANTTYYLTSAGSTIYIDKITFDSVEYAEVKPSFKIKDTDTLIESGTYEIDGYGSAAIGETIQLPKDVSTTFNVTVTDAEGVKYTGSFNLTELESAPIEVTVEVDKADIGNIDYWFDDQDSIDEGKYTQKGTHAFPGGTVTLYDDFQRSQSYTYNGHTSYQGIDPNELQKGKALDASGNTIAAGKTIIPASGNAYSFTPNADGTVRFYGATGSGKSYSLLTVNKNGQAEGVVSISNPASEPYTAIVKADYTYYMYGNSSTGASAFLGFEYIVDKTVQVSGTVTKGSSSKAFPANVIFTPEVGEAVSAPVDGTAGTFGPVTLKAGVKYTITTDSEDLMFETEASIVPEDDVQDLALEMIEITQLDLTGTVTVQGQEASYASTNGVTITYTNKADNTEYKVDSIQTDGSYTVQVPPGTYKVSVSDIEGYTPSSLSVDDFTVSYANSRLDVSQNFNNILYKKNPTAAANRQITVDPAVKTYDGTTYPTISEALEGMRLARANNSIIVSAVEPWEVSIKPGTYTEQLIVDLPYVTFKAADPAQKPVITWYYGVGYKYYSIKPNASDSVGYKRGYYDIEYAYDKHSQATADRWGTTVRVTGTDFYAENIIFEASFNRKYDEATETADGVAPAPENEYGGTGSEVKLPVRTSANFADTAATERAAAMVLDNAQAEFYNCSFLSSQDTLYMGTGGVFYFNGCKIMGETDYIFGDVSTGVFDDCTLAWAGYTGTTKEGYLTAARGNMLFRNCTITSEDTDRVSNAEVKAGYLGRHWADSGSVNVIFADTKFSDGKTIDSTGVLLQQSESSKWNNYYMDPSSLTKGSASLVKEFYCTTDANYSADAEGGKYTEANTINEYKCTKPETELQAADVQGYTYLGSWEPRHYAFAKNENAPQIYGFNLNNIGLELEANASSTLTSTDGNASVTIEGPIRPHETHGSQISAGAGIKFTVTSTSAEDPSQIPVKLDFKLTANAASVNVKVIEDDKVVVDSEAIQNGGDTTVEFNAASGSSYAVVFSAAEIDGTNYTSFYSTGFNITVTGADIKAYESKDKVYDFSFFNPGIASLTSIEDSNGSGAGLNIENINYHGTTYGAAIGPNDNATASFTIAGEDASATYKAEIIVSTSYQENSGYVTISKNDDGGQQLDITTTDSSSDATATYTIEGLKKDDVVKIVYNGLDKTFYTKGITVITEAELAAPAVSEPRNIYNFNIPALAGDTSNITEEKYINTTDEKEGTLIIDPSGGGNLRYNDESHGYQVTAPVKFRFTIEGSDPDYTTDVTFTGTYTGSATVKLYKADNAEGASEATVSGTNDSKVLSVKGAPGEYVAEITAADNFYMKDIVISTTGTLASQEAPVPATEITWEFDPTKNAELSNRTENDKFNTGYVSDNKNVSLFVDLNNVGKFATNSSNWMQIANATIKVPVFAAGDKVKIYVYKGTTLTGVKLSENTGAQTASSDGYLEFTATDPGYMEITVDNGTSNYINKVILETHETIPASLFKFKEIVQGTGEDNTIYVIGEIAEGDISGAERVGINAAKSKAGALADDAYELDTPTVFKQVVDGTLLNGENGVSAEDGKYIAAIKITDSTDNFFVSTYSTINGVKVYDTVHEVTTSN